MAAVAVIAAKNRVVCNSTQTEKFNNNAPSLKRMKKKKKNNMQTRSL